MEKVYKLIKQKVVISPNIRSVVDLKAEVYSQDIDVTKIIVELEPANGERIDLTDATVTVGLKINNVTIEDVGQVEDVSNMLISYCPGERFKINEGTVTLGFFVTLNTGQRIDIQNYKINFKRSLIDTATEEEVKPYFTSLDTIVSELKEHTASKQYEIDDSVNHAKSEIEAKVNTVETAKTSAVEQICSYLENSNTAMDSVVSDVRSTGETAKVDINAVVSDVNGYSDSQKQVIHNVVSDVQSTGDAAKIQINQVLPDVQSKVSAINTELAKIDENMPDLFVAYADHKSGHGFNKTDASKIYKGYGVKNSNSPSDYRWERNIDNLQVGGRNLLKDTASDLYNKRLTKDTTKNYSVRLYPVDGFDLNNLINKTVVLSFRLKNDGNYEVLNNGSATYLNDRFGAHMSLIWKNSSTGQTHSINPMTELLHMKENNKRVYAIYTFRQPDSGYDKLQTLYFNMNIGIKPAQDNNSEWFLGEFKLELGNTPTDWTPAPEDQASKVELNELKSYIGYTDTDIYGVEIDMTNKTFKRLSGAVGKNGGADFDNINAYKRRRCILANDGKVLAYHGESNYTESGTTTAQIVKNGTTYPIGTPVQVMVEQPKFYYKVVPLVVEPIANGKGYHMRKGRYYISDYPKSGFKVHPAFVRNGVERDKIYLSAYEGNIYDTSESAYLLNDEQVADFSADMLSSVANAKPCSGLTQKLTRSNARLLAHNRGNGWEQQTIQAVSLTQLLFLIEYAKFNMQDVLGMGATQKTNDGSTNMAEKTGSTNSLGNASGTVTNSNSIQIVSYRGEENPYGNIWKFVDGINVMTKGIHEAYVADHDFNDKQSTGSYTDVGFTLAKTSGYVSAFGYSPEFDWLFLTSETTGNSSVPVGDYFWQNYTGTDDGGWRAVRLGASWSGGSDAGGFYWNVITPSVDWYRVLSGRLVYLGGLK